MNNTSATFRGHDNKLTTRIVQVCQFTDVNEEKRRQRRRLVTSAMYCWYVMSCWQEVGVHVLRSFFCYPVSWAASCSAFFSPKRDADACLNLVITIFSLTGTEAGCPLISNRTTTRWLDGFTCSHNQSVLWGLAT